MFPEQDQHTTTASWCYSATQTPTQTTTTHTEMKATIIYLPPFRHTCKNVPPAKRPAASSDSSSSSSCGGGGCEGDGQGGISSSSSCHQKYYHYYYVKQTAAATPSAATQQQQQQLHEQIIRKRRRNLLHATPQKTCVPPTLAVDTPPALAVTGATTLKYPHSRRRQSDLELVSSLRMEEEEAAAAAVSATQKMTNRAAEGIRRRSELKTKTTTTTTIATKNACLADDRFKLRINSQLVMPIGGAEAEAEKENNEELEEKKTDSSRLLGLDAMTEDEQDEVVVAKAAAEVVANISKTTTTLKDEDEKGEEDCTCRCFKVNGDIMSVTEEEELELEEKAMEKLQLDSSSSSSCSSSGVTHAKLSLLGRLGTTPLMRQFWQSSLSSSTKLILALVLLVLTSSADCWAGRQDVPTNCTFPARWEGSWFLSGYQQSIHIKGSQFSYRGKCAASDGNKFLIVDEKGCHRCLVIYEKHKNVLQYKESECEGDSMYMHQSNPSAMAMRSVLKQNSGDHRGGAHPNSNNGHSRLSSSDQYIMRSNDDMNDYFCKGRETLQNLCDQIPGDALLYSLFRESAEPVKCPLKGPFVFTYNRGHGECKSPVSNIESCTEDSRLLLSFQACPDVQGTESTVEELTCLATWKDGNSRYLVGLVSHHHAISNEERYRCFVYEKISSLMGGPSIVSSKDAEYKLAQSGDATCNGLDSAEVGSRIMSLRKPPLAERCDFPAWFKGPRHWHALMGNAVYNYHSNDGSVHIIKPNGYMETRALCEQINKQTGTEMMAVVHYTTGCQSGFMCMMFYRRDTHVIEIQTGKQASRLEDACAPDHFDVNRMPYITLLASNPDPQICPMEGLYTLRGAIGPPYLTTRHKRNHNNNRVHGGHGHHHHELSSSSSSDGGGSDTLGHKRHTALSFRNSERIEKGSWHANTRGLPARSRRDALVASTVAPAANTSLTTTAASAPKEHEKQPTKQSATAAVNKTDVAFVVAPAVAVAEEGHALRRHRRRRRDAPGCITNYKAQRQLWVGCTEPNVIDVRPLCNEEGDEEYSCHGSWTENGTVYIIARHKGTKHGVCISYRPTEGTAAKLVIGDACYRGTLKPPEHHLVANLSVFGKCGETGSASAHILNTSGRWWAPLLTIVLALTTIAGEVLIVLNHR